MMSFNQKCDFDVLSSGPKSEVLSVTIEVTFVSEVFVCNQSCYNKFLFLLTSPVLAGKIGTM